jgi:hypothetical protein
MTPRAVAAIALLAGLAGSAAAQTATDEAVMKRMMELDAEILELEDVIRKIETQGHVTLVTRAGGALLSREQIESLFVTLAFNGADPSQLAADARQVGIGTRIYLNDVIKPDLERARRDREGLLNRPLGASPTVDWPVPMDWMFVRGTIQGTYHIPCSFEGKPLPPLQGPFRLNLTGDGGVAAWFTNDFGETSAEGTISADGGARGSGMAGGGVAARYSWSVRFVRSGDTLMMSSHTLQLEPEDAAARCEPGYLRPE